MQYIRTHLLVFLLTEFFLLLHPHLLPRKQSVLRFTANPALLSNLFNPPPMGLQLQLTLLNVPCKHNVNIGNSYNKADKQDTDMQHVIGHIMLETIRYCN